MAEYILMNGLSRASWNKNKVGETEQTLR